MLAGLVLWFLLSALLLGMTGGILWTLRQLTPLRQWDGAKWARWTALALLLPLLWASGLTAAGLLSVSECPDVSSVWLHGCLHSIRHWCGHASESAYRESLWLLWGILGWLSIASALWFLAMRRQPQLRRLPPSTKLRRALKQASVPASLPVWEAVSDAPAGLVGVWRPFLFVAQWMVQRLSLPALCAVLRHECAHWHRRDHWLRWLFFGIALLFALVPFVHWLHREWRQAAEEAADDWASTDEQTAHALAQALTTARQEAVAVGVGFGSEQLERRIQRLKKRRHHAVKEDPWWTALVFVGGLVVTALTFFLPPLWLTLHCFAEALLH